MKDNFEIQAIEPTHLLFTCKFGVYPKNGNNSVCYCTDKTRASLITNALNCFDTKELLPLVLENENLKRKLKELVGHLQAVCPDYMDEAVLAKFKEDYIEEEKQ